MKIYLAGTYSRDYCVKEAMKLYLAGEHEVKNGSLANSFNRALFVLESFYYCQNNRWLPPLFSRFRSFMLDSGAFTYIAGKDGAGVDWKRYVDEYAEYIIEHNIDLFIELDIDCVVGLKEVERLRKRLEKRTGKQPIIAWHDNRGKDYFIQTCKDYKYNAIGTTRAAKQGGVFRGNPDILRWFIDTAHEHGSRIHGLGYTNLRGMTEYHFDSVDSTAWLYGNRGGFIFIFDGKTLQKRKCPPGKRLKSRAAAIHNFNEWVKFQKYAEAFL
jgi:hypothetical protein